MNKKGFIFPGQGAQFTGMGKNLYDSSTEIKQIMEDANDILGFRLTDVMFSGSDDELKQTNITQPAIYLHSLASYLALDGKLTPDATAGHSLGEFMALVAAKAINWQDALRLVYARANAMQKACEMNPSTMAAILGLEDSIVEEVCATVTNEVVVAANYNSPGQIVISGSVAGIELAVELLKQKGAKRAIVLQVGGAFHSPLMLPAQEELAQAIASVSITTPICPIYQNINANGETNPDTIKTNLMKQLTGAVKWTQTIENMYQDGITDFYEFGPGKVLSGLVKKIVRESVVAHADEVTI